MAFGKRVETTDSWVGDDSYIGYRGPLPTLEQLQTAETMENEMVKKGAKVTSQLMTREEALSTAPDAPNIARLPDNTHLRVVTIEGCRGIPCGGTHLKDIHEIGQFRLTGSESRAEGFRVKFDVSS
jgi:Ser-tRNA(Ala) deacylase AlaX